MVLTFSRTTTINQAFQTQAQRRCSLTIVKKGGTDFLPAPKKAPAAAGVNLPGLAM